LMNLHKFIILIIAYYFEWLNSV